MTTLIIAAGSGTIVRGERVDVIDAWVRHAPEAALCYATGCVHGVRYDERLDHEVRRYAVRVAEPSLLPERCGEGLDGALLVSAVFEAEERPTLLTELTLRALDCAARRRDWSMTPERFWEHVVRVAMNGVLRIGEPAASTGLSLAQ